MPRSYVRVKPEGISYSQEDLQRAVDDIKNGNHSGRSASTAYGIPRTTLRHYVNGTRGKLGVASNGVHGGGGKIALSLKYEEQLANCLRVLEKHGNGFSRDEVLDLVQDFVITNNISTRFKDNRPGSEWFINFRKRHNLSIKKPQGVEFARRKQESPFVIHPYFDQLEKIFDEYDFHGKPHLVFNVDETSFAHDPTKTKVVGAVGQPCTRVISSCGRENTSVLVGSSASGIRLPLLIIFKGKNIMEDWINIDRSQLKTFVPRKQDTAIASSDSGWMKTDIFCNWFHKVFLPNAPSERPILLTFDGHSTHISIKLIEDAVENDVILFKLPPKTSHRTQPMDVGINKGLKSEWDKRLVKWQRLNPRKRIPKKNFQKFLRKYGKINQSKL